MAFTTYFTNFFKNFTDIGDYNTLAVKFLLFVLFIIVFGELIKRIPIFTKQKWVQFTLTLAVPAMAIFFFPDNFLRQLLIQYKRLGISLILFPFFGIILYLHRIDKLNSLARRGILIFFFVIAGVYTFKNYKTNTLYTNQIIGIFAIYLTLLILLDKVVHKVLKRRHKF